MRMRQVIIQGIFTKGDGSLPLTTLYWFRSPDFSIENLIYLFTKQVTSTRRSTVLSPPLQLDFPA
jgi:hypothetical protein